ncbi:MAG TPA: two-component regulator propeller domain-containing protein, partial [Chitinophagaceae bacterium]
MKLLCRAALLSLLCAAFSIVRGGEILPVRSYTTSDGLVSNFVQNIVRDSKGFLWFCTRGGLSRFDGHTFKNYTTADGLPHPTINQLLETRGGEYWIATNGGGVARLNQAQATEKFTVFKVGETAATNQVNYIFEDRTGRIWATTDGGLFLFDRAANIFRGFALEPESASSSEYLTADIDEDRAGTVWVTGHSSLHRISPNGE